MEAEQRFRAMGTDVHVVVHGPTHLADEAQILIEELEARWSRFVPTSEVSELNRHAGEWVSVSPETITLVERALEGQALTDGAFDPTILGDLVRAGYDRSFEEIVVDTDRATAPTTPLHTGAAGIEVDRDGGRIRLPVGVGFDPGGLGKGLAADLVAERASHAGAAGALINIGGDLRAVGYGPEGDDWTVAIDPAADGRTVTTVTMHEGGLATSTTLRRRWELAGSPRHHLIDPATGAPTSGPVAATVLAARGWQAEILAKAILVRGVAGGLALVASLGADALVIDHDGTRHTSPGFDRFLAHTHEGATP